MASPIKQNSNMNLEKGDNTKYINFAMALKDLPEINKEDAEQVQNRINEYFALCAEHDCKPAVSGLALALGTDRRTLWRWQNGKSRGNTHCDPLKKAYNFLEVLWEEYMLNGKINPASGIFLGKNNWGYTDEQKLVVEPNNPLGDNIPTEELKNKYIESTAEESPERDELPGSENK